MTETLHQIKALILGPVSLATYVAAEFFALIALVISLYADSRTRDVNSSSTPVKFSWAFLIWDNAKRVFIGQLCLFVIFRFASELVGKQLNMFFAMGAGFVLSFGLDKVIQFIKNKSALLQMNRDKMIDTISNTGTQPPKQP